MNETPDAHPELLPWAPLTPRGPGAALDAPWWIAGGYALEMFVGRTFRHHRDIDVLILRDDVETVHLALQAWDLWAADPPGTLRPWRKDERIPARWHDIWCRPHPRSPWTLQIMVDECTDGVYVSRRHASVRGPLETLGLRDGEGIPYLAPEVQLFYKARAPRAKDDEDLRFARPRMSREQRTWLRDAERRAYGVESPWYPVLSS